MHEIVRILADKLFVSYLIYSNYPADFYENREITRNARGTKKYMKRLKYSAFYDI